MLGQPVSMLIPKVVGFKLTGAIPTGVTATDVVLTITQQLRKHGVVGKFVEFYGAGVARGAAREPRHHRQHEPGVRLDRRDVPDRRRDARLPPHHRPRRGAGRARRGVREAPEALARPRHRADVQRVPRARPLDGRPVDRRPEAPAGPRRSSTESKAQFEKDLVDYADSDRSFVDAAVEGTFPASDPIGFTAQDEDSRARARTTCTCPRRRRPRRSPRQVSLADGTDVHARPRRGRRRGDHLLHEHLEPERDARRRPARPEREPQGPEVEAVGQDHARAGLQGRHGLLRRRPA